MRKGKAECISPDDPESLTEFHAQAQLKKIFDQFPPAGTEGSR